MSDVIYEETYEDILPCYYVGMLLNISLSALVGIPFCIREYLVGKVDIIYVFTGYCGYIALVLVFYSMLYLSICKDYKKISFFFAVGMTVTVFLSFLLVKVFHWGITYGMLLSLTIGFWLIACLEMSVVRSYFKENSGKYRQVLVYFKEYWPLVVTNFLYILGLYVHNFVFWTTYLHMKKVLFVINTLGGAGAERALLELLKRFTPDQYEVDLYILLEQGELISQVPEYVNILNRNYTAESVLSAEGKKKLNKKVFMRLFTHGALFKNIPYLIKNAVAMLGRKKIYADKLLWRIMSDSGMKLNKSYDMAVAYLEGGATYFVHDHVKARKKFTFLHVDYKYAGYSRGLDRDCYLDFDRIFTVSGEVKSVFDSVYPECRNKTFIFHNLIDREEIYRKSELPGGFSDTYTRKRILTVGRLTAQKAYEVAVDAMKLLKDQGIKARWYVLGEGELRNKLQQKIDSLGLKEDFLLLGAKENPYPYYKQCDLYVHATRFEGKSIAIQEAQVLGCTILVSDCSGNREQVENGTDGILCQLSPEDISRKIAELLGNEEKCREYGKKATVRISDEQGDILKLFEIA